MATMLSGEPLSVPDPLADAWDEAARQNRILQAKNDPLAGRADPPGTLVGSRYTRDPRAAAAYEAGAGELLKLIPVGEGTSGTDGYDVTFGYGKYAPEGTPALTAMTLDEVAKLQREMVRRGAAAGVVGRYQIKGDTLARIQRKLGISGSEMFTPDIQDRMARELLLERGYDN